MEDKVSHLFSPGRTFTLDDVRSSFDMSFKEAKGFVNDVAAHGGMDVSRRSYMVPRGLTMEDAYEFAVGGECPESLKGLPASADRFVQQSVPGEWVFETTGDLTDRARQLLDNEQEKS